MRIAYLLTSLGIGGAERQAIQLAECMADRGHTVLIVILREKEAEEWSTRLNVVHLNMRKTPEDLGDGLVRAWRHLRAFRPDVVHSHTFPANSTARLLSMLGAARAAVMTIHNNREGVGLRRWVYRATDSLCAHTTAVSADAAERFIASGAVPRRKCTVLPNAIDASEFAPDPERRSQIRKTMGVGDKFIWLAAGRFVPEKDYPNMMRAFESVWPEMPDTELWIAGESSWNAASDVKRRYSALAARNGTRDRVRLLGLRRDVPALLDAADGFVLSSASEGMPLVIGEAMAMEKAIVATDVGGVHELMGETGSLVSSGDSQALAGAMLAVMRASADVRAEMGRMARARIVEHFSMSTKAQEWERLYRSLRNAVRAPSLGVSEC